MSQEDFKIRCWIPENNEMIYSDKDYENYFMTIDKFGINIYYTDMKDTGGDISKYMNSFQIVDAIVMLSLNHNDKNNNEIYEHDIVEFDSGRMCEVVWFDSPEYHGWDLKALNCKGSAPAIYNIWNDFIVIGNKYENLELYNDH